MSETSPLQIVDDDRLTLSLAEAAIRLGVHRTSLRAAIDRGEIRAVRLGRRWLVPRDAIDELLAQRSDR